MPLTENQLKALRPKDKPYTVTDERGLYVEVSPTGGKLWRYRYRIGKIEKKLSIGTYPDLSLKKARHAALEARILVSKGGDPAIDKRKQKIRAEFIAGNTFEEVAREYIDQMMVRNGKADETVVKANYFLAQLVPALPNGELDTGTAKVHLRFASCLRQGPVLTRRGRRASGGLGSFGKEGGAIGGKISRGDNHRRNARYCLADRGANTPAD